MRVYSLPKCLKKLEIKQGLNYWLPESPSQTVKAKLFNLTYIRVGSESVLSQVASINRWIDLNID